MEPKAGKSEWQRAWDARKAALETLLAGGLVSNLSNYSLNSPLNPNDTIDLGAHQPPGHTVRALLLLEPDPPINRFELLGQPCALLLLVGITTAQLDAFRGGRADAVLASLRAKVAPFTDLKRPSLF